MFLFTGIFKNLKAKLKSPVFWLAVVMFVLKQFEIPETFITEQQILTVVDWLIVTLIGLGVLNNPEDNLFERLKNK